MNQLITWLKTPAILISIIIIIALALVPAFTSSRSTYSVIIIIAISAVFAISYNLLAGYTGILSLGHALFFGTGAYCLALMMRFVGQNYGALLLAIVLTVLFATLAGLFVGYLTLRLKTIYYAMVTFAFAELFVIIADQWREVTGGPDGLSFNVPQPLQSGAVVYYVVLIFTVCMILLVRQFLESPTGKVLVAIRENEQRASALGYNVYRYKLISSVIAGLVAGLTGVVFAIDSRYVTPGLLGITETLDGLLMTIVGGMGTLLGPVIGAAVVHMAGDWLSSLAKLNPIFERWPLLFGLLYIVIVLTMPGGIMSGYHKILNWWQNRKAKQQLKTAN